MSTRIAGAALALLLAGPAFAQYQPLLPFAGVWSGTGEAREGLDAPWELASCDITIEWMGGLRSQGACEGARGRFSAGGIIEANGDALSGTFLAPNFVDVVGTSVALSGGALVTTYVYGNDGVETEFRLTVRVVEPGVMAMRTEARIDGVFQEVGRLTLTAQ